MTEPTNIDEVLEEPTEKLAIVVYYGSNNILNLETTKLTPVEASDLMKTISQLVVGIVELRENEK